MTVKQDLQSLADAKKAMLLTRFFKTGKGQYGEGDKFLGIPVPNQRIIAKKYRDIPLQEIEKLLHNTYHESRLTALLILCNQFEKAEEKEQKKVVNMYLKNTKYINNWDLVDLSSHEIVGGWLLTHPKDRGILFKLAKSKYLWEKRIAVISCFALLRNHEFNEILTIAEILLHDEHDLIHKAVGWALREIGKRDLPAEESFLKKHCKTMPRTMLRYAIEHFPQKKRLSYLTRV